MRERFRSFDSKISFFAFADIITAVSGMLIFITLLLATDLGHPTDNRSQAANAELEKELQETLTQQAKADAENRGLQQLLTTANTAPAPEKLASDISRLRTELADEKRKHAGIAEQLAASKSALDERDKLLGITAVRENIQQSAEELTALEREEAKERDAAAALEQKISGVEATIRKLHSRANQTWLIPDRSQNPKEPILAVVGSSGVRIDRFNRPDQTQQFDKSGARSGFAAYLKHCKSNEQYIVFLIRPSGIALFKDLEKTARQKGFEVGFDALEENREVHFSAPPPIDDQEVPGRVTDRFSGPTGTPGAGGNPGRPGSGASATVGSPGNVIGGDNSSGGAGTTGGTNATGGTNTTEGMSVTGGGTNATGGTNAIGGTNAFGTNTTMTGSATNAANAGSSTNAAPPPPPPKPKSWWQRLLEWIGIGK